MSRRFILLVWLLLVGGLPGVWVFAAASSKAEVIKPEAIADALKIARTNLPAPSLDDARIAYATAGLLERQHFLNHPFDDEFSDKFLDRYLEALDPQHLHFTQEDLAEFERYRTRLDDLTRVGDTTPAYRIFNRFYERLAQRVAYAGTLLQEETFTFDTDERIITNRKDASYPRDLAEAHTLWRQRLRFEYLEEKLVKLAAKKKAASTAATTKNNRVDTLAADPKPESDAALQPKHILTGVNATNEPATANAVAKETKPKTIAEEIVETLNLRYARNLRFFREWGADEVLEIYLTSLAHVYDPHSDYFGPPQAENFAIGMNLSLFGIGAELRSVDGYCTISKLMAGGPAAKGKQLSEKDRIVAVAQSNAPPVDVVEMSLNKVVQLIRGPKGTEVRLTVIPVADSSARRVITIVRDEIKLVDQAAKAKVIDLPTGQGQTFRLGIIDLPTFYVPMDVGAPRKPDPASASQESPQNYTSVDVAKLVAKLEAEKCQGIILDLRRNGGGSLEECVKLTGMFIKDGPIVQVNGAGGHQVTDDPDPAVLYDGPLVVLTSRFSASASEILAGALQDYGRAIIVGDLATHGKGTVQNLNPLRYVMRPSATATNDPGTLKITRGKFYRVSGGSTQLKGVLSDIVLPSKWNYVKEIGESALENALQWDNIPSAKYDQLNQVAPYLQDLLSRSNERISTNQDFVYIREDIEQFRKFQAEKTISLNEKERLKEMEDNEAREKARNQERLARKAPEPTVYELTLKQAELPGLPAPTVKTNTLHSKLTGAPGATHPVVANDDPGGESDGETAPVTDATLEEAGQILMDYVGLLRQKGVAAVNEKTQIKN
jgi:carboxyl-terminal processing protease